MKMKDDIKQLRFNKNHTSYVIWWVDDPEKRGEWLFTFDKVNILNMFADYPHKLTKQQKEIFDKENPYWADFFSDR